MVSVNYGTGADGTKTVSVNTTDGSGANTNPGTNNYTTFVVNTGITLSWGAAHATNYSKNIYCTTSATITGTLGGPGLGYYGGGGGGPGLSGGAGNSPVAGGGGVGGGGRGAGSGVAGGGGANGGNGTANYNSAEGGSAYGDSILSTIYNGAGGGGGGGATYEAQVTGGAGGYGGGALQLCAPAVVISGTINLTGNMGGEDQQIVSSGGGGSSTSSGPGGGGAGGSCFIGTNNISGTGTINCTGGGARGGHFDTISGAGAGGRIRIQKLNGNLPTLNVTGGNAGTTSSALYQPAGVGSTIVWFHKQPSYSEFIVSNAQIPIEINGVSWVFSYADNNFLVTDTTFAVVYNLGALYGKLSRTSKNFATYTFKNLFSSAYKITKEINIMGKNLDSFETENIFNFLNAKFLI